MATKQLNNLNIDQKHSHRNHHKHKIRLKAINSKIEIQKSIDSSEKSIKKEEETLFNQQIRVTVNELKQINDNKYQYNKQQTKDDLPKFGYIFLFFINL